ncbi:MAG TPA: hypothetical protein PLI18_13520 [Pirellulaceae bacterium]|nr:hypothetical protein [Pirellulaceae bacterium]
MYRPTCLLWLGVLLVAGAVADGGRASAIDEPAGAAPANVVVDPAAPFVPLLSDDECWRRMPQAIEGSGQPLPNWAKAVATHLPRTAAAMLVLDHAHRTRSPLDPELRAKFRWVVARENRCDYSQAVALDDLRRAGATDETIATLQGASERWPEGDRDPLEFARWLTVDAPSIDDALFERIRRRLGDEQVAAMVLHAAYGNFQDRIVLGLGLPLEPDGPLPPLDVRFAENAFQLAPLTPQVAEPLASTEVGDVVADDPAWSSLSYEELQKRLERQRERQPRLPIPTWDEVKGRLPPAMAVRPTRIVWSLITYGYAAELQIPWSICTRTMWAELPGDRVFEESLFWIQTRTIRCNYCMGHCEMLMEVAGLSPEEVAQRTRRLAGSDWSAFPAAEQRAFDYARKLTATPWALTASDYRTLERDLGPDKAMSTFWWLCRGLYMTRISDGFQLPLERENVFAPPKE